MLRDDRNQQEEWPERLKNELLAPMRYEVYGQSVAADLFVRAFAGMWLLLFSANYRARQMKVWGKQVDSLGPLAYFFIVLEILAYFFVTLFSVFAIWGIWINRSEIVRWLLLQFHTYY